MRLAVRKLRVEDVEKLQSLVVEHFDAIEPGLTVLDARLLLGHATIDVIGVDTAGTLVLGAVDFTANEQMLLKAVEAYSWCLEYPEALVRLYPSCQLSEGRPPRLLFVVERVPDAFQRKIKQLGFPEVDCVEVRHLDCDGVATVYFETLLRLRRGAAATAAAPQAVDPADNVVTMTATPPRPAAPKMQKLLSQGPEDVTASPRASERPAPSREPAPVVSMVSRQATAPARVERPGPAPEPIVLPEPEPLIADPVVEAVAPPMAIPALEPPIADVVPALELEPIALHELPEMPVRPVPATEVPLRPVASTEVPTMTPTPEEARVSFKELATALLGAAALTAIPAAQPIAAAPAVKEPAPVLEMPKLEPVTPVQVETPVAKVAAPQVDEIVAPALTVEALVASAAAAAPASPQPAAPEAPKPVANGLPQEFEGLKFPNDGVLTRQWMEFLSQMSGAK